MSNKGKLGKHLGGQATFGYEWKDRQLVPDPKESPIRKVIYELFLEHKRKKTAARILNDAGYRTRNRGRFNDTIVGGGQPGRYASPVWEDQDDFGGTTKKNHFG